MNIHSLQGDCSSCRSCHREEEVIVDEKPSAMVIKTPCDCVPLVDGDSVSVHYCCLMLRLYTSATPCNEVI